MGSAEKTIRELKACFDEAMKIAEAFEERAIEAEGQIRATTDELQSWYHMASGMPLHQLVDKALDKEADKRAAMLAIIAGALGVEAPTGEPVNAASVLAKHIRALRAAPIATPIMPDAASIMEEVEARIKKAFTTLFAELQKNDRAKKERV